MTKRKLIYWLLLMLACLGLVVLVLCVLAIPYLADRTAQQNPEYQQLKVPLMLFLYLTALPFYAGVFQAMRICREILKGNEFTTQNAQSLILISYYSFSVILLYFVGAVLLLSQNALHSSIAIIILTVIFMAAAIAVFGALLSHLVQHAVLIKEENDHTV